MSSTRAGSEKRDKDDFYPTPRAVVDLLFAHPRAPPTPTLDPCAGDGALLYLHPQMIGVELDEGRAAGNPRIAQGDGLGFSWAGEHVLTNPPFKHALEFVSKGVAEAETATFLLPLNWLASVRRATWWPKHRCQRIFVLCRRPRFVDGKSDSIDYAWFHWDKRANKVDPRIETYWLF